MCNHYHWCRKIVSICFCVCTEIIVLCNVGLLIFYSNNILWTYPMFIFRTWCCLLLVYEFNDNQILFINVTEFFWCKCRFVAGKNIFNNLYLKKGKFLVSRIQFFCKNTNEMITLWQGFRIIILLLIIWHNTYAWIIVNLNT